MMTDLEVKLSQWHKAKYGRREVDLERTLVKATEELGELAQALLKGDWKHAQEEAADVAIVMCHMARGLGGSLELAMRRKYKKLVRRLSRHHRSK